MTLRAKEQISILLPVTTQARVSGVRERSFCLILETHSGTCIQQPQSTNQLLYQPLLLSQNETFLETRCYLSRRIQLARYCSAVYPPPSPTTLLLVQHSSQVCVVRQCRRKKERNEELKNIRYPSINYFFLHQLYQVLVFENILESINFVFHMRVFQFRTIPSQVIFINYSQ